MTPDPTNVSAHEEAVTGPFDPERTSDFVETSRRPMPSVPGYEMLRELGRGGMGVVYLARHLGLKREVALKMLLHAEVMESSSTARRFMIEAEALAAAHHPNIIQIFDRGEHLGLSYFAMEYCPAGSLADRVREAPLPPEQAARVVEQIARGVAVAHERGILHRDLKPANVLYSKEGTPKVSDFGLAKRIDDDSENITHTGTVLGTPSYMAPEQAEGKTPGTSVDVYALGAILYRLVAGRPPFSAATSAATIQMVISHDPISPRQLNPAVPRDLETICLKCLAKAPAQRYLSATALADDLERFLRQEPILARPAGKLEKAWKWARRNPSRAAFLSAAILLLITIATASSLLAVQQRRAAQDLEKYNSSLLVEQTQKEENLRLSRLSQAQKSLDHGLAYCERGDIARGLHEMVTALAPAREAGAADLEQAIRYNLATWERELWQLRDVRQGPGDVHVWTARPSPDGAWIAAALSNNTVEFWPMKGAPATIPTLAHQSVVAALEYSSDGRRLLTQTRQSVQVWSTQTGKPIGPAVTHTAVVASTISRDGRFAALAGFDGQVKVWKIDSPAEAPIVFKQTGVAQSMAFHPALPQLMTSDGVYVRRWNAATGEPMGALLKHDTMVVACSFSPDGTALVSGTRGAVAPRGGKSFVWSTTDGRLLFESPPYVDAVVQVAFGPDGKTFATRVRGGSVHLRRAPHGEPIACPIPYDGDYTAMAYHPDGTLLATGGLNGQLQFWETEKGSLRRSILHHQSSIRWCEFSPGGGELITVDGAVRTWQRARGLRRGADRASSSSVIAQVFTGDGAHLIRLTNDGFLRAFDTQTGEVSAAVKAHSPDSVGTVAELAGGKLIVTGGTDRLIRTWGTDLQARTTLRGHTGSIICSAVSADEKTLLTASEDRTARLWNLETSQPIGQPLVHDSMLSSVAMRPDGAMAVTGSQDGKVRWWRVPSGELVGSIVGHRGPVDVVQWSPDGKHVVTGGLDGNARVWSTTAPEPDYTVQAGRGGIRSLAIRADHRFFLTGGLVDLTTYVRAFPGGDVVSLPIQHLNAVRSVAIAPDGRTAMTASYDTTARRWQVPTGIPIGPALPHSNRLHHVCISADGQLAATSGVEGSAGLWMLPGKMSGEVNELRSWAEGASGLKYLEDGSIRVMSAAQWSARGPLPEKAR